MMKKAINYISQQWKLLAEYDKRVIQDMFDARRYPYALFMCHLALEKILKSIIVQETKAHAPFTHNLVELAKKTDAFLSDHQKELLSEFTEFNMEARYPDWKKDFYKKANRKYTNNYLQEFKTLYLWLTKYLR
jgi:HEPN domain-containing protein